MNKKPHNVDILTLDELESKEINNIIDLAIDLKKELKKGKEKPLLQNKTLAMIFIQSLQLWTLMMVATGGTLFSR